MKLWFIGNSELKQLDFELLNAPFDVIGRVVVIGKL